MYNNSNHYGRLELRQNGRRYLDKAIKPQPE